GTAAANASSREYTLSAVSDTVTESPAAVSTVRPVNPVRPTSAVTRTSALGLAEMVVTLPTVSGSTTSGTGPGSCGSSAGGSKTRAIASGPERPSSAASLSRYSDLEWWRVAFSPTIVATVSAINIAVAASSRAITRPGSQDTIQPSPGI